MECPRCDADIGSDANYCRSCGLPVGKIREAVRDWSCPRCEIELDDDRSKCPECGLKVGKLRERLHVEQPPDDRPPTSDGQQANEKTGTGSRRTPTGQSGKKPDSKPTQTRTGRETGHSESPQQQGNPGTGRQNPGEQQDRDVATAEQNHHDGRPAVPQGQRVARSRRGRNIARQTFRRVPVLPGVIAGVAAYIANVVLFLILVTVEFPDLGEANAVVGKTEFAGWFLYNAHRVRIEGSTTGIDGTTTTESVNYLVDAYSNSSTTVPYMVYYLVPMVVLYLAGMVVVRRAWPALDRWQDGAVLGVPLAAGYATATLLGAVSIFSVSASSSYGSESLQPELATAVLIMGVIYPVVIGGLAGVVGARESLV